MGLRHHVFGSLLEAWWNRSWALSKLASWTLGIPDRWTSDECRPYTCSQGTLHHWWDKLVFFSVTLLLTDHTSLTSRSTRKSWRSFVRNLPFSSFSNSTAESLLFWCSFRPSYVIFCRLSAESKMPHLWRHGRHNVPWPTLDDENLIEEFRQPHIFRSGRGYKFAWTSESLNSAPP